jgi:hypothetical protein
MGLPGRVGSLYWGAVLDVPDPRALAQWPPAPGQQQMMLHLDLEVDDLPAAVQHALSLGATLADHQPQDTVRVLLDPVGHPFCLYRGAPDVSG